ncbi:MAG: UDP-N-acetylmuramoyl-L-alanyl-D-glutamate--2,6-diaminopimelate ligase [Holosporaceae bacterium]|nr:UDP-N-acetylmuramoyl-L-alanyl-D-glutamate--2,6-diaminopimelate ligase [Holosporaceae bacterium]
MKKLSEIVSFKLPNDVEEQEVSYIYDDSRKVTNNSLFVAINGSMENGEKYIDDALANGARYIVLDSADKKNSVEIKDSGAIFIYVDNPRKELSHIASKFFSHQLRSIVAVTGTNGKTSTVDIIRQIWAKNGKKSASVGTIGVITDNGTEKLSANLTSPGPIKMHKILSDMSSNCIDNVALEASSHGINQHRLDNINFSVCAFTNMTTDHMDYHKTMENYWKAKERLFSEMADKEAVFVVNSDDVFSKKIELIAAARGIRCMSYGRSSQDLKIISVVPLENGQQLEFSFLDERHILNLPLYGTFQCYNSLCAIASCLCTGIPLDGILAALKELRNIAGRLELVTNVKSVKVFLDYAHTPDALKNSIMSVRSYAKNRVVTVFGCGGNRDPQKRKAMGEVAEQFSDFVFITDDNPRDEDPESIRKMIVEGFNGRKFIEVPTGRRNAIEAALEFASNGDCVLVAGKGHESYQKFANEELVYFSDRDVILDYYKASK